MAPFNSLRKTLINFRQECDIFYCLTCRRKGICRFYDELKAISDGTTKCPVPPRRPRTFDLEMFNTFRRVSRIPANVCTTTENAAAISENVANLTERLDNVSENLENKMNHGIDSLTEAYNYIKNKIVSMIPDPDIVSVIIELLTGLFFSFKFSSLAHLAQSFVTICLKYVSFSSLNEFIYMLLQRVMPASNFRLESDSSTWTYTDFFTRLTDLTWLKENWASFNTNIAFILASCLLFFTTIVFSTNNLSLNNIFSQAGLIGRACIGLTGFHNLFMGVWKRVDSYICKCFYGRTREEIENLEKYPDVMHIFSFFNTLRKDKDVTHKLFMSKKLSKIVLKCQNRLNEFLDVASMGKDQPMFLRCKEYKRDLKEIFETAHDSINVAAASRNPPVCVTLRGASGRGKTNMFTLLATWISKEYYDGVSFDELTYSRKAENEYWDGYKPSHKIVKYDDAFQVVDSESKPNPEFMEIIRLCNTDPYQLHMSDVKDKKGTYFAGEFVVITTNDLRLKPKSLVNKEAVKRRLDIVVDVDIKPEFLVDGLIHKFAVWQYLNKDKTTEDYREAIRSGTIEIPTTPDIYSLRISVVDPVDGKTVEKPDQTFDDLCKFVKETRTLHNTNKKEDFSSDIPELYKELLNTPNVSSFALENDDDFDDLEGFENASMHPFIFEGTETCEITSNLVQESASHVPEVQASYFARVWDTLKKYGTNFCSYLTPYVKPILGIVIFALGAYGLKKFFTVKTKCEIKASLTSKDGLNRLFAAKLCDQCDLCDKYREIRVPTSTLENVKGFLSKLVLMCDCMKISVDSSIYHSFFSSSAKFEGNFLTSYQDVKQKKPDLTSIMTSYQETKPTKPSLTFLDEFKSLDENLSQQKIVENIFKMENDPETDALCRAGQLDECATNLVRKVCGKNLVQLITPLGRVKGLVIKGRIVLVNRHFTEPLVKNGIKTVKVVSTFERTATAVEVTIKKIVNLMRGPVHSNRYSDALCDTALMELGPNFTVRPDITSSFPKNSEFSSLGAYCESGKLSLLVAEEFKTSKNEPILGIAQRDLVFQEVSTERYVSNGYEVVDAILAKGFSQPGDCGSPIVLFNSLSRPKLIGIHNGQRDGTTIGQPISQDDLTAALNLMSQQIYSLESDLTVSPLPNSLGLGLVKTVPGSSKSSFEKNELHGIFPTNTDLSVMSDPKEDILIKNSVKFSKNVACLDPDLLEVCKNDIINVVCAGTDKDTMRRLLSYEESIAGIHDCDYIDGLNRGTSPGYPYNLKKGNTRGKTKWLGEGDEYRIDPNLVSDAKDIEEKAKQGIFDPTRGVFFASLKDERRTLDKIAQKKTRVFTAGNMALSVAMRRYTMAFVKHIMEQRITNEIGLGINVYSLDWRKLVKKLAAKGDHIIAGDFSNFDGSLNSQILELIPEVITAFYGDEHELTRRTLMTYLFNYVCVFRDRLVQFNHSQPSGNTLTTVINCLYNMFIFRYVYMLWQKDSGMPVSLANFSQHVAAVYYGDDSILSISPLIVETFNQQTISKYMSETGHVYTDETKTTDVAKFKSLNEVTFLKRSFKIVEGLVVAPLAQQSIQDMIMWKRKDLDTQTALDQVLPGACVEAALHDRNYYEFFVRRIRQFPKFSKNIRSFYECIDFIRNQQDMPSVGFIRPFNSALSVEDQLGQKNDFVLEMDVAPVHAARPTPILPERVNETVLEMYLSSVNRGPDLHHDFEPDTYHEEMETQPISPRCEPRPENAMVSSGPSEGLFERIKGFLKKIFANCHKVVKQLLGLLFSLYKDIVAGANRREYWIKVLKNFAIFGSRAYSLRYLYGQHIGVIYFMVNGVIWEELWKRLDRSQTVGLLKDKAKYWLLFINLCLMSGGQSLILISMVLPFFALLEFIPFGRRSEPHPTPLQAWAFAVFEMVLYLRKFGTAPWFVAVRILCVFLHVRWASLPLAEGMYAHLNWNVTHFWGDPLSIKIVTFIESVKALMFFEPKALWLANWLRTKCRKACNTFSDALASCWRPYLGVECQGQPPILHQATLPVMLGNIDSSGLTGVGENLPPAETQSQIRNLMTNCYTYLTSLLTSYQEPRIVKPVLTSFSLEMDSEIDPDTRQATFESSTLQTNDPQVIEDNDITRSMGENVFEVRDQSLIESLSRTVELASDVWTEADGEITATYDADTLESILDGNLFEQPSLKDFAFPRSILNQSTFVRAKLWNIAFMKADVEVTVKVQATPFLQGSLWLWQTPYTEQVNVQRRCLNEHLRSITSFPGVELNLQKPSRTVTLRVPFTSEFSFINPNDQPSLADVRLSVLVPLTGPTTGARASYVVLARLVNIKLYGHAPSVVTKEVHPIGFTLEGDMGEDEQASNRGIVSSVSNTVASVAGRIGDASIPYISSIAKPIGWVAQTVGNVASLFGFSKVTDQNKNSTYSNVPAKGFTHVEGIDQSVPLAALPNNAIDPTKCVFSEEDEMSIQYVAERPYLLGRVEWAESRTPGTVLATIPVNPAAFSLFGGYRRRYRTFFTGPIGYVASMFNWWRGQVHHRIKFAKTQYHQGRLLVQYLPYGSGVQPIESVLSKIIDLSEVDDEGIEIHFPTVFPYKWCSTREWTEQGYSPIATPGSIVISVLTPLIAASTVSSSVTVYAWQHWSEFEVAEPGTNTRVPARDSSKPSPPPKPLSGGDNNDLEFGYAWKSGATQPGFDIGDALTELETAVFKRATVILDTAPLGGSYGLRVHREVLNEVGDLVYSNDGYISTSLADDLFFDRAGIPTEPNYTYRMWYYSGAVAIPEEYNPTWTTPSLADSFDTIDEVDSGVEFSLEGDMAANELSEREGDKSHLTTTMGEKVVSLRSLSRRFTTQDVGEFPLTLDNLTWPTKTDMRQCVAYLISWLYRFNQGSLRFKVLSSKGICYAHGNDPFGRAPIGDGFDSSGALHIQNMALNPILELSAPYYNPCETTAVGSSTFNFVNFARLNLVQQRVGNSENSSFVSLCATGDDHSFTFLVGPPAFTSGLQIPL